MQATIMSGKIVAASIKEQIKKDVEALSNEYHKRPKLTVIIVGNDPASLVYVRNKKRSCEELGIESEIIHYNEDVTEKEIEEKIKELSMLESVSGILLQLPLPKHLDSEKLISFIPQNKDVDGLTNANVAALVKNQKAIIPCTPLGVIDMLKHYQIEIEGKSVAIIGRSMLVGKPLSSLFLNNNATVTICHSKTQNIKSITSKADIVVVAIGKPRFLKEDMIKEGAVVVDVGINRLDGKLVGDADFDNLVNKASFITPVPGGCGVMTVTELLKNTITCFKLNN